MSETLPETAAPEAPVYLAEGHCPICDRDTRFVSQNSWYRDFLVCETCEGGSIPRERALVAVLKMVRPDWRTLAIHESSPCDRGASLLLKRECPGYVTSQFFPGRPLGEEHDGFRNENMERQTFADAIFDIVVTQDVMEHVNRPDLAFRDIARTLKPGGQYIFTCPTYKERVKSQRRAIYFDDSVEHLVDEPEYHANPVDPKGALVTFHYGYDLAELIHVWSGMDVCVQRFHDHRQGIIGEFTEVYVCTKHR